MFEKALVFFDYIEEEYIELTHSDFEWEAIEKRLSDMIKNRYQIFKEYPK